MKRFLFLMLLPFFLAATCNKMPQDECMGKAQPDMVCTMIYKPVCGCDGKTYGNDCEARRAGVQKWKEGACK